MVLHWWTRTGSDWWFLKNLADQDWIGFNFSGSGLDSDWEISQSAHLCSVLWPVLPTLQFSFEFELVFFVELRVFLKTCGLLVFGLVLIEIYLFLGVVFCKFIFCRLLFCQIFLHFCCFYLLPTVCWACFYENLLILGLFFSICLPIFYIIFFLTFGFVEFSCQRI